jgi:hypothetical protein
MRPLLLLGIEMDNIIGEAPRKTGSMKFVFVLLSLAIMVFSAYFALSNDASDYRNVRSLVLDKRQETCGKHGYPCFFVSYFAEGKAFDLEVDASHYRQLRIHDRPFITVNRHQTDSVSGFEEMIQLLNVLLFFLGFTGFVLSCCWPFAPFADRP